MAVEKALSNNGSTPAYRRQGDGKPFVYVCGIEGTGLNFFAQATDLERDHCILSFQLRPDGKYGMETLVEDVAAIVADAGFEKATFLGESFGGLLTMATALAYPELFSRMLLVNTFAWFRHRKWINFGLTVYTTLPYKLVKIYRNMRSSKELFSDDMPEEFQKKFLENTSNVPLEGYISRLKIIRDTDLRPRLQEIKVPTLVVASTGDAMLDSMAHANDMISLLPNAKMKIIEGTGHVATLSKNVNVRDWLNELPEQTT
jgi:pimeloyl-ACP methyl ester carboxylesterase